ncbi:Imprinted and ancient [Mycena venus]|uniref:Imprinted and ancient n=1 Tax=Mycena venus TaxID=2733690 RepID=A0A8H6YVL3_9AGAR|nr:Imprinted and ancient [Mycena venus]
METPFSSFLGTPSLTDLDMESPLITDLNPLITGFGDNLDLDLFGAAAAFPNVEPEHPCPRLGQRARLPPRRAAPSSLLLPPLPPPRRAAARTSPARARTSPPAYLIPLDAPTQKRTYVTPSATSRKAVPDAIVKKRLHSVAFSDDKDIEEELGALSPTASEAGVIEYKRQQNTLAARKSRKWKLEHQQALEEEVASLNNQVTMWRERAMMAQELLRNSGR